MHRSEIGEFVACSECGVSLASGQSREFEFGESLVLCFDCALRRGGCYDEARDRWSESPSLEGLDPARD